MGTSTYKGGSEAQVTLRLALEEVGLGEPGVWDGSSPVASGQ